MKKSFFLALVFLFGLSGVGFSETIDVTSKISEVTVFPDQAQVVRSATVKLPKGAHTLRLPALSGAVSPDSVTAKGSGERAVKLFGAELKTTQLELPQDARVREIERRLKELRQKGKSLNDTKEILSHEREYLISIRAASSDQIGKDIITKQPGVAEVSGILAFLDKEFLANYNRLQETDNALEEFKEEIDKLSRELGQLNQSRWKQETAIQIEVEAEETGQFNLEVSYRIPGASWYPSYEARAESSGQKVGFGTFGTIRQQTGEEWENVKLTLSTARPSIGGRMPELPPWFLRKWEGRVSGDELRSPQKSRQGRMESTRPALSSELQGDTSVYGGLNQEDKVAEMVYAQPQTQGPAVTYVLPKATIIKSDGQPHKVPVAQEVFTADVAYETTPKLIPQAFLRAKIKNTTENLYLAGSIQVFLDGAFVTTSYLKQTAPQEEFDLFLGVDERIKVERKKLKDKVDISLLPGFQGRMKAIDRTYLTTVQNFTPRKAKLILTDQIPVSQFDDIKIESVAMNPKSTEEDKEKPGVHRWVFELAPNQKQEITLSFRIRHPVDLPIEGL